MKNKHKGFFYYLLEGYRSIGKGFDSIGKGFASFTFFPRNLKEARKLLKISEEDGFKQDAENLRKDWEKILGKKK